MLNVKFLFTYIYIYSLFCKLRKIVFDTWLIKFWSLKATVNSTSKFVPSRVKTCVDVINKLFVNAVFSFCLSCFRKLNETWQPKIILLHEWRKEWKTCSNGRELVTQPLIFTWFHWLFYVAWCKNYRTGVTQRLPFVSIFVDSEKTIFTFALEVSLLGQIFMFGQSLSHVH